MQVGDATTTCLKKPKHAWKIEAIRARKTRAITICSIIDLATAPFLRNGVSFIETHVNNRRFPLSIVDLATAPFLRDGNSLVEDVETHVIEVNHRRLPLNSRSCHRPTSLEW